MSVIGKSGTRLAFSSRKVTLKSNKRLQCFDPYWGRTTPENFDKNFIYFTFDYLHMQTEEFVKELNKILSYVQIEFLDKKEKTIWSYNDAYGKRYSTIPIKKIGEKVEKHKVLTGKFKVVFDDFFLDKIKEDYNRYHRYGSVAQTLAYLCHHILCSLAVSEGWLKTEEKFSEIKYSKYGKDFADFVAYLSSNRNTGSNRRLSTYQINGTDVKQIGNKTKIKYICQYPQLFTIGKQTQTISTFGIGLSKMKDKVLLAEAKKKEIERLFGKEGGFAVLHKKVKQYTDSYSSNRQWVEYLYLIKIKKIDLPQLIVYWDIIYSDKKSYLKTSSSGLTTFSQSNYRFSPSSFVKDAETGKYKIKSFGINSTIQSITKVNKRTKNNKIVVEALEKLTGIIETREKELPENKKFLDSAVKTFESIKIPNADSEHFEKKYSEYCRARTTFFNERKRYDTLAHQVNLLKNMVKQIKQKI